MDNPITFQITYRYSLLGAINKTIVEDKSMDQAFDNFQKNHPQAEILGVKRLSA